MPCPPQENWPPQPAVILPALSDFAKEAQRRISLHSPELPHANRCGSFFSSAALHQCSSALISGAFDFDVDADSFATEVSNEGQNNNEVTAEVHAARKPSTYLISITSFSFAADKSSIFFVSECVTFSSSSSDLLRSSSLIFFSFSNFSTPSLISRRIFRIAVR